MDYGYSVRNYSSKYSASRSLSGVANKDTALISLYGRLRVFVRKEGVSVALWGEPLGGPSGMSSCHLPLPMQPCHLEVEGEIGRGATEKTGKEQQGLTGSEARHGKGSEQDREEPEELSWTVQVGEFLLNKRAKDPCSTEHGPAEGEGKGETFGCHQQGDPRQ